MISYIVNKNNIFKCQEELFKKGYSWYLNNTFRDLFKEQRHLLKEDDLIVIHVKENKELGWDFYSIVKNKYNLNFYGSREDKLKRILND